MIKLRHLFAVFTTSAVTVLAVACGGASDSELFSSPTAAQATTEPSGNGSSSNGGNGSTSSGQPQLPPSSSSSSSGSTSSSSSSSSSSSGGTKDAGPTPVTPKIYCGAGAPACTPQTEVCCAYGNGEAPPDLSCEGAGLVTCIGGTTIACDDRSDCPANQVCCGMLENNSRYSSVECKTSCNSISPTQRAVRFCDPKATGECPNGSTCAASASLPGYYVCKT